MTKPIITEEEKNDLISSIKSFNNIDGILNQIDHLYRPDENEVHEWTIEYIERSILELSKKWKKFSARISKLRDRANYYQKSIDEYASNDQLFKYTPKKPKQDSIKHDGITTIVRRAR